MTPEPSRARLTAAVLLLTVPWAPGCLKPAVQRADHSPYRQPQSMAVAVFSNRSGSADLDVMAATDAFYTELQAIEGIEVVAVNLVIAAMEELQMSGINSPGDAMLLAQQLALDGVIVGSVTSYDPYFPPKLGMVVELYRHTDDSQRLADSHVDPGQMARAGRQVELSPAEPIRPTARVTRILDADESPVVERLKRYADGRGGQDRPYGWKLYTTRQNYLRFVSHEIITELMAKERQRLSAEQLERIDADDGD